MSVKRVQVTDQMNQYLIAVELQEMKTQCFVMSVTIIVALQLVPTAMEVE